MALTLYSTTVPYFIQGLTCLSHILKKAETHCKDKSIPESDFISASLAPDMLPLPKQVQIASDTAKKAIMRILGTPAHPFEDNETTFAQLQERIAKTLEIIRGEGEESAFASQDPQTEITVPMGKSSLTFTKLGYVQGFALPNFYFHVVTAYAILRMKGVEVGKTDFLKPQGA